MIGVKMNPSLIRQVNRDRMLVRLIRKVETVLDTYCSRYSYENTSGTD
jgi:hypothetical protein